jgi:hypothetical protein
LEVLLALVVLAVALSRMACSAVTVAAVLQTLNPSTTTCMSGNPEREIFKPRICFQNKIIPSGKNAQYH